MAYFLTWIAPLYLKQNVINYNFETPWVLRFQYSGSDHGVFIRLNAMHAETTRLLATKCSTSRTLKPEKRFAEGVEIRLLSPLFPAFWGWLELTLHGFGEFTNLNTEFLCDLPLRTILDHIVALFNYRTTCERTKWTSSYTPVNRNRPYRRAHWRWADRNVVDLNGRCARRAH